MSQEEAEFDQLVRQARDGNKAALGTLLENYRGQLRALGRESIDMQLAGRFDASDLVQQTLISAVQAFEDFRGTTPDELAAWLKQIQARNFTDAVRAHRGAMGRSVDREQRLGGTSVVDRALTPSKLLSRTERAEEIERILSSLPVDQAVAVRMRHLNGCKLNEIAATVGKSERAVAGLLFRGMKKLKKELGAPGRQEIHDE
ncbi:MAG: sigma-70 family RNA polymerase sigma factor [Planctomycetaceae bacterium]